MSAPAFELESEYFCRYLKCRLGGFMRKPASHGPFGPDTLPPSSHSLCCRQFFCYCSHCYVWPALKLWLASRLCALDFPGAWACVPRWPLCVHASHHAHRLEPAGADGGWTSTFECSGWQSTHMHVLIFGQTSLKKTPQFQRISR